MKPGVLRSLVLVGFSAIPARMAAISWSLWSVTGTFNGEAGTGAGGGGGDGDTCPLEGAIGAPEVPVVGGGGGGGGGAIVPRPISLLENTISTLFAPQF
uniref:Putative secreted peptide n=1 Tax=Anopheles braziliensis TaxID=58242 RepID=A0A2M3ZMQ3_9DIPT